MECNCCGNCCLTVGRTFWKAGAMNGGFDAWPGLKAKATNGDHEDGNLPCEMLLRLEDGKTRCYIEVLFGVGPKPQVCRDHQGDDRCKKEKIA